MYLPALEYNEAVANFAINSPVYFAGAGVVLSGISLFWRRKNEKVYKNLLIVALIFFVLAVVAALLLVKYPFIPYRII